MIRICSDCRKYMGEKPPYEDTSVTHGMCPACVKKVRKQLREIKERRKRLAGSAKGSVDNAPGGGTIPLYSGEVRKMKKYFSYDEVEGLHVFDSLEDARKNAGMLKEEEEGGEHLRPDGVKVLICYGTIGAIVLANDADLEVALGEDK